MARTFGACGEIIVDGSSGFIVNETFVGQIASGSSGVLLNVPAQQGKSIKLSYLVCTTGPEAGITIDCGLRTVVDSLELEDFTATGNALFDSFAVGANTDGASNILEIVTEAGEGLTITKDTGTTSSPITYCYQVSN